jgi:hypothetical protein
MAVKEVLQALGTWDINLSQDVPRDLLDALDFFGHVAVVPGRLDPVQYGDGLLSSARYVGVLRERDLGDQYKISGTSMALWLGDEDGKGAVYETPVVLTAQTFANSVRALLPSSGAITEGTLSSVPGTYTGQHQFQDPRTAITYVCGVFTTDEDYPVEWKLNGTGTLDAGPVSALYVTTPQCVISSVAAGYDMDLTAMGGTFGYQKDTEDFTTRVVLLAEGEGTSIATGSADIISNPYKDIHGNAIKLTRLVSESDTSTGNADTRAQLQLNRFTSPRDALTLSASDFDIRGSFQVGDYVWVYDPDSGLYDTSQEITFRGQRINPIRIRVSETQWPVTDGHTVAYRDKNGVWYDLTDYVQFESPGSTSITVGGISRSLTSSGTEPVGSRPNADSTVPGVPTLIEPFLGTAYLDGRGFTRARVILSWSAPLNTDGSTVLDGDHYEIRYAVDTDMVYPASWAAVSQVRWQDLQIWAQPFAAPNSQWQTMVVAWDQTSAQLQDLSPGIGYDVQIRAVDSTGNMGAWSATTTFVATEDNIAPSVPAAPTVAASRIALQITHTLGKASGGTFNLESDLHHLEIHAAPSPDFTPSPDSLLGKLNASAGMIQAQIPAVGTYSTDQVVVMYVRVIAVDIAGNRSGPSLAASATAQLIDDAHISDLTVSKVTAGSILADWIVSARIKTSDTGARTEMSSAGFESYNTAGTRTFFADATTGDVTIIGQLKSGTSGRRLEINPTSTYLPELRFFANNGTDYGYINGVSSGSDVSLGMNSSLYDDGLGVQSISRVYLTNVGGQFAVVRADTGAINGGYTSTAHGGFYAGYFTNGTNGGQIYGDFNQAKYGWNHDDADGQYLQFTSGRTRHIGKWADYVSVSSNEGLFTGDLAMAAPVSGIGISWGPTTDSPLYPVAMLRDSPANYVYMSSTPTTSGALLDFAIATTGASSVHFWCWRM